MRFELDSICISKEGSCKTLTRTLTQTEKGDCYIEQRELVHGIGQIGEEPTQDHA